METEEKAESPASLQSSRRKAPRFGVEEDATLTLVSHGSSFPCRVIDLSLGGCRLRTKDVFRAGRLVRVEVDFKVRGLAFRFGGVTQWTDSRHLIGIHFVDVIARRSDELAEALGEIEEAIAVNAQELATQEQAVQEQVAEGFDSREEEEQPSMQAGQPVAPPAKRYRREQCRQDVDTSAVIYLVKIASRQHGRILDLSLGGCLIRTDEPFLVGIYTRVEIEFNFQGLPILLGGVTQAIHDRHHVGIRFLDMSQRKRDQLELLIEEIED